MSFIGSNIKKIRGVKNLSQSEFADIFKLKRGAIGAYEEGRAEPKIETILTIAKYFGISLDDLLTRQLSVNDLYRFDIFRKDLSQEVRHNLTPSAIPIDIIPVPYVTVARQPNYFADRTDLSSFPSINIPLNKGMNYRAFEIEDNAMVCNGYGPGAGDIIVGVRPDKFEVSQVEVEKMYLFELDDSILLRSVLAKSANQIILAAYNQDAYSVELSPKAVITVWQLTAMFTKNISSTEPWDARVKVLEDEIKLIKDQLSVNK